MQDLVADKEDDQPRPKKKKTIGHPQDKHASQDRRDLFDPDSDSADQLEYEGQWTKTPIRRLYPCSNSEGDEDPIEAIKVRLAKKKLVSYELIRELKLTFFQMRNENERTPEAVRSDNERSPRTIHNENERTPEAVRSDNEAAHDMSLLDARDADEEEDEASHAYLDLHITDH